MASFISLLILNKATTYPGTHWPLQPQMTTAAAGAFYNMEAKLVLWIKIKKKKKNQSWGFRNCFAQLTIEVLLRLSFLTKIIFAKQCRLSRHLAWCGVGLDKHCEPQGQHVLSAYTMCDSSQALKR